MDKSLIPYCMSIILYLSSLPQSVLSTAKSIEENTPNWGSWEGLLFLIIGPLGIFDKIYAWLANPFFIVTCFMFFVLKGKDQNISIVLSVIALLFALSFLFIKEFRVDEAGGKASIISLNGGYWCWVTAMIFMIFACIIRRIA